LRLIDENHSLVKNKPVLLFENMNNIFEGV